MFLIIGIYSPLAHNYEHNEIIEYFTITTNLPELDMIFTSFIVKQIPETVSIPRILKVNSTLWTFSVNSFINLDSRKMSQVKIPPKIEFFYFSKQ